MAGAMHGVMEWWWPHYTLPILGSVITGGLIGFEREHRGRAAGVRTHILLSLASTLLMLAAAIKTVAVDTSSAATLAKVAVYFGMGVLYICTGYFIPVPGGRGKEPAPEEAPPSSGEK